MATVTGLYSLAQIALYVGVVSAVAIAARLIWVFPGAYLPFLLFGRFLRDEKPPSWQSVLVLGWAGMRGTITLAAALSIPKLLDDGSPFPSRNIVIFLSLGVVVVTLLLQGTTLEFLICKLGLRADESRLTEERLARTTAVEAGLKLLRQQADEAGPPERAAALGEVIAEYEHRLAELTAEGETRVSARRRVAAGRKFRLDALRAERAALDDLWLRDAITDDIHRPLQQMLDHEESMLNGHGAPVDAAERPRSSDRIT